MTLIKGIAGLAAIGAAMLTGLIAPSAQAGYVVDVTQEGSNVVATGSGAIDLTGLSRLTGIFAEAPRLFPSGPSVITGPTSGPLLDGYTGVSGPASFGSGPQTIANSGSGDFVGLFFGGELDVPYGYVSDSPLSDSATYLSKTFSTLGVTPGTYKWTWGPGANQNFTLVIGAVVPEPSTWAMTLFGFVGLGLMGRQRASRRRTVVNAEPAIARRVARRPERGTP